MFRFTSLLASIILLGAISASASRANDSMPSEEDMRVAVALWFGELHAPWRSMGDDCAEARERLRNLSPGFRVTCPISLQSNLPNIGVSEFLKIGCRPPMPYGHVYCTFTAHFLSTNPMLNSKRDLPRQGFFSKQSGRWRFQPSAPQPDDDLPI